MAEEVDPREKRKQTILRRYGSYKKMLEKRDKRDLILGGINGGRHGGNKGFASWDTDTLSDYARQRTRDSQGRFVKTEGTTLEDKQG